MGASISYRQVNPIHGIGLRVGAPSFFIAVMEKAFGRFPVKLNTSDRSALRGMAAMHVGDNDPYTLLIEAIDNLGEIEVYAEW